MLDAPQYEGLGITRLYLYTPSQSLRASPRTGQMHSLNLPTVSCK